MIQAKVVADSLNEFGNRITTMVVTFPRFILAETNTHRMLSRNSASSRAIPFRKMIENMFGEAGLRFSPIAWQKDHTGMQGTEYFTDPTEIAELNEIWDEAAKNALMSSTKLSDRNVTKQLCNRLLEPFMWHTVIITATEWENFFALRCPQYYYEPENLYFRSRKDYGEKWFDCFGSGVEEAIDDDIKWLTTNKGQAEIHMMALAEAMWDAKNESVPVQLKAGEWHIPFGDNLPKFQEFFDYTFPPPVLHPGQMEDIKIKIATARCARISYTVVGEEGKEPNYENDIRLHDRLKASGHMSPFEHCAKAMSADEFNSRRNWAMAEDIDLFQQQDKQKMLSYGWSGNFRGFIQYRKMLPGENIT